MMFLYEMNFSKQREKSILTNAVDGKVEKQLGGLSFTRLQFALKIDHFDHICNKKMIGVKVIQVFKVNKDQKIISTPKVCTK